MATSQQPLDDAARFFELLSNESRLKILWLLLNHRELCLCHVVSALDITQEEAMKHLSMLEHSGLVKSRAEGDWSYCAFQPAREDLSKGVLRVLRSSLSARSDAAALLWKVQESLSARGRNCVVSRSESTRVPRAPRGIAATRAFTRIQVFEPPARCSTTLVCGRPATDPVLAKFTADVRWLKSKGCELERYDQTRHGIAFDGNAAVCELLRKEGNRALPITIVNGVVVCKGTYPSRAELWKLVDSDAGTCAAGCTRKNCNGCC